MSCQRKSRKNSEKAREFAIGNLLPNPKINKIMLFGSLAKGTFGKYEKPFHGRKYSDVDVLLFVKDDYKIPRIGSLILNAICIQSTRPGWAIN